jgi:copper(I)-binding protein
MLTIIIFSLLFLQLSGDIIVKDSWMRPNGKGMTTALYFNIQNNGDKVDTLYKASSDIAKKVEIHETYQKDDMMGMREAGEIIIPANSTFEFKPGSFHIMLIGLKQDVKKGDQSETTLFFRQAGEIKIKAIAKEMSSQKDEHHH